MDKLSGYHARKPPSSAPRWGGREGCTASINAQDGYPRSGNGASRTGTCGHQMCAEMLLHPDTDPQSYLGMEMVFWVHPESDCSGEDWRGRFSIMADPCVEIIATHTVDQELIDLCMVHVEYVRERVALTGATMYVENSVPIDHITGEVGATGSCDVALVYVKETAGFNIKYGGYRAEKRVIEIIDLKLGRMPVLAYDVVTPVHTDIITGAVVPEVVEPYEQLAMYASGMIRKLGIGFEDVILTISQPPLKSVSQWSGTVAQLQDTIDRLSHRAIECDLNPTFRPSASNCHFCRASGNCAAQTEVVIGQALVGFDDVGPVAPAPVHERRLGDLFAALPMVQDWCSAVMDRTRAALTAGEAVVRSDGLSYKLVKGKAGARKWVDEGKVVQAIAENGIPVWPMYESKLVSPTTAEKFAAPKKAKEGERPLSPAIAPDHWTKLQELIIQVEGQPTIVLETDPRPPLSMTAGFDDVPDQPNSDLF